VHPNELVKEEIMLRIALYIGGVAAGIAALIVWRDQVKAMRKVPAKEAAEALRAAWAEHNTRA
jgi:hypothetical protein